MNRIKRRSFLAATTMGSLAASRLALAASDRVLRGGVIGCGWYGNVDIKAAFKAGGVQFDALCDVDSDHLKQTADNVEKQQGSRPKTFKDYRELIESPGLDFLILATPPHWHALPFIAACDKKLAIYSEKPLAYDIREGRAMVNAAERAGNLVQVGFQRRQSQAFQEVRQYVASGKAGRIVQADVQIHYTAGPKDNTPQDPPPALDWDLWCGPAPKLPYTPNIGHFVWRLEKAYGNGHLVDWGIHLIDATRVMLNLAMPKSITAAGGIYQLKNRITTPDTLTVHFDFDECPVVWRHRIWGSTEYNPEVNNGIFLFGENATLFATDDRWVVVPKDSKAEREEHKVPTDLDLKHMQDFLEALRQNQQPSCRPADAFRSTATVQLAMIAYQAKSTITWDAQSETIQGNSTANALLKREYRAPWKHPYTG